MRCLCAVLALTFSGSAPAFASDIQIVTDPEGAEVSQGAMHLGVTTKEGLRIVGVEPGMVTFTISKPGFETVTRVLSVESGTEPITVVVRLQPATPGPPEATPTTPSPDASPVPGQGTPKTAATPEPSAEPKQKGSSNTALIILGGAALVGGGVAALTAGHGASTAATTTTTTTTVPPTANLANLSATLTSPQQGAILNCNQEAFFTVSLTNTAHALVYVTGVRLHQTYVDAACGAVPDFTYQVTNSQVGTGTADVLNGQLLSRGGVGCCVARPGCGGSCHVQFSFTVLTSVGEVTAGLLDFSIVFNGCSVCLSATGFGATRCLVKP